MPYESLLRGRTSIAGQYYVVTTVTANRYPLFLSLAAGRCIVNGMRDQDAAGHTQTFACVVMPDHVHWLIRLQGQVSLGNVMRQFKGRTAHELNVQSQRTGRVWQRGFHDHAVRTDESFEVMARYIIENPVRARLVSRIGDYSLWHSAWDLPLAEASFE